MKRLLLVLIPSILFSACSLPFLSNTNSGVQITSSPQAEVFIDENSFGNTPVIRNDLKPGLHNVKIIPQDGSVTPWEGQVKLYSGIISVIDRELSADPTLANGHFLSYEKTKDKTASLVNITTTQPNISISVDGSPAGFTPLDRDSIPVGPHSFLLSAPGYQDKVIQAKIRKGYKLIIQATLATQNMITPTPSIVLSPTDNTATPSGTPTPSPNLVATITTLPRQASPSASKPYVEILDTPTGFLRVRSTPKVVTNPSNEVAKLNPQDRFPYLDSVQGWYQIQYLPDKKGWVSASYAKLVK